MPTTNTRDKVECMLNKLASENTDGHKIRSEAQEKFLILCDLADILNDEFCANGIQINAEPSGKHGVISVETDDIVFEYGRSHKFFKYIKSADFLSFSKSRAGMLKTSFGIKDLWVRA